MTHFGVVVFAFKIPLSCVLPETQCRAEEATQERVEGAKADALL